MLGKAHNLLIRHGIYRALPHREGGGGSPAFQAAQSGTSPLTTTTQDYEDEDEEDEDEDGEESESQ
jgi:hypothetical protein